MKFAILGLLVVLVIAFFVLVWKAAKDWRWYQIVPTIFTMLLAVVLIFPTAGVLGSRSAWHKKKEELEERVARIKVEHKVLKYGDPSDVNSEGITQLTQRLSEIALEAGRRWRDMRMTNINGNNITLVQQQQPAAQDPALAGLAGDDADADAAAAPPSPLIPETLVVYGFAEQPDPSIQATVPTVFLGEFHVTASTPTQVTISPTSPRNQRQMAVIQQAQSWSLYEMLPLDGHMPFIAEGSVPNDDAYFGRVDEDLVRRVLGQGVKEETIQKYLRDGSRATQDDPPLSRWVKLEFTKKHSIEVDSPEQRGALFEGFFDGNGRAVDSRLQRGDMASFNVGDQVLLKEEAANELIDEGIARLIDQYYIRPPNDYRYILRRIRLRLAELEIRKEELAFEKQVLDEAIAKTVQMIGVNQDAKLKLEQDFAQVQVEKNSIEKYAKSRADNLSAMKAEMVRLHRKNLELEQKLQRYHLEIEQRLETLEDSVRLDRPAVPVGGLDS